MQIRERKLGQCIFCSFRLLSRFSTSLIAFRETKRKRKTQKAWKSTDLGTGRAVEGNHLAYRHALLAPFIQKHTSRKGGGRVEKFVFQGGRTSDGEPTYKRWAGATRRPPSLSTDDQIRGRLKTLGATLNASLYKKLNMDQATLEKHYKEFKRKVLNSLEKGKDSEPLLQRLRQLSQYGKAGSMDLVFKYSFYGYVLESGFSAEEMREQDKVGNLRFPAEWFPATRTVHREFHLHVGPTNSGKTYHALKRLELADKGLYAGPLRLLAHEVYMRLNARGQRCNLITGDERRTADDDPHAPMVSSTVEMVPLNALFDVAVIDEIQLIGSEERGWAWTQAVLGVQAREVHLCGEERTVPIIKELAAACGEKLHIHRYERLSPLKMAPNSLKGDLRNLQKGDCVVAFSIQLIHGLRQAIERTHRCKVAVIYGTLPPETRAQQARLFNDQDNDYDILVASNAVGMGLNLSVKRIVFFTSGRQIVNRFEFLPAAEVKQIAGRAGRYSTAEDDMRKSASQIKDAITDVRAINNAVPTAGEKAIGLVTTLEEVDFPVIKAAMEAEAKPIGSAGLFPPAYIIERFAKHFPPRTPFSYLLMRLHDISKTASRFHLCDLQQQLAIADVIEPVEGLTTTDKSIFCSAPIEPKKSGEPQLARAFASLVAGKKGVSILEVPELDLDLLEDDYSASREYLQRLERLHKGVIIWMWLAYRYSGVFLQRDLAIHVKELVENRIEAVLNQLSFDFDKMRKAREQKILDLLNKAASKEHTTQEDAAEQHADRETETNGKAMAKWLESLVQHSDDGHNIAELRDGGDQEPILEPLPMDEASGSKENIVSVKQTPAWDLRARFEEEET